MPGRNYDNGSGYRYGFNGKENDKDICEGDLDFGARIYDSRLGRWLATDPLENKYPNYSPYSYSLNNPILFVDENGKWVRDQYGNIIVTIDKGLTKSRDGKYEIGSRIGGSTYTITGSWGYILANNGKKVEVFVPTANTVIETTYDILSNVTGTADVTASCDGQKNCTSNSLMPNIPNIVISSDQITDDVLKAEGFVKGSKYEKMAKALAGFFGITFPPTFSAADHTKQGDIVVYGTGSGNYEHFEYFQNATTVDTKGGVQLGPIPALPGLNPNFSNPEIYINTDVGDKLDPKVNTTAGTTSNGQTTVDKKEFKKIRKDVKKSQKTKKSP